MPRARKLKVYRTPIGFHDAYVAATSRKAALQAWGSDADLFARGLAEQVEDPELMREPLARPGTVIRRLRATREEQLAALPERRPVKAPAETDAPPVRREPAPPKPRKPPKPKPKPKPRPDRGALDTAEEALAAAQARHAAEQAEIARRQAALDRERRQLEQRQGKERETLEKRAETAREKYERAMRAWRG